jgi:hypothetical protein
MRREVRRKRRKREQVRMEFIVSAVLRLSALVQLGLKLDDGAKRSRIGNVVGKPVQSNPRLLAGVQLV